MIHAQGLALPPQDPKLKREPIPTFARSALAETKVGPETKVEVARKAAKMGRPRKHDAEPWVAEGISKATWFRRQKAKSEK